MERQVAGVGNTILYQMNNKNKKLCTNNMMWQRNKFQEICESMFTDLIFMTSKYVNYDEIYFCCTMFSAQVPTKHCLSMTLRRLVKSVCLAPYHKINIYYITTSGLSCLSVMHICDNRSFDRDNAHKFLHTHWRDI